MSSVDQQSQRLGGTKEEWLEKDRKYVWHHISPHNDHPLIAVSGEGSWITDQEGKRYLDAMSGLWCVNVGHGREEIAKRAYDQMKTLAYIPMTQSHEPAILLAEKLNEWLEGEYRIFFSNSGSDANEVAFKIARQFHHQNGEPTRHKFISRHRAYHGNSMGALGATGQAARKIKYEPLGVGFSHVPPPYCYRCPFGKSKDSCGLECAAIYEEVIQWEGAETVAGVIMEPVITGGGMIVPPPEYMRRVQDICQRYGVLFIVDEVICGFGRSGQKFGHQNYGVEPDIVTMAKGMTSAYAPLSATAIRADLYESFREPGTDNHFRHVNTFGGNPVSCRVALANLEILEREQLVSRAAELGQLLGEKISPLLELPSVGDIRLFGFACGIEMIEPDGSPATTENVTKVLAHCKREGILIGKNGDTVPGFANILTLSPPFVTTEEELDLIVSHLFTALRSLDEGRHELI
ncbi:aspartate aminotransferase family protein [Paenibacillus xylanexedens]|uniref:aspartate aminotransferase family protein n=1 Tax=Paenibacillus xylanexedens TaxID=528191 RepID=UPI0011A5687D|nr:aspartate aminotransferase family protein [Paenibacillus xylanexedens]